MPAPSNQAAGILVIEPGIEITSDMANAGGKILQEEFDAAPYWSGHVASQVFRAMAKASQGSVRLEEKSDFVFLETE